MVWAAKVFHWPPEVTRRQSVRDLRVLMGSYE